MGVKISLFWSLLSLFTKRGKSLFLVSLESKRKFSHFGSVAGEVSTTLPVGGHPQKGAKKSTQTFFVQCFWRTLRVMDVRAENRGRPHQKLRFSAALVMGRKFLTPWHPGVGVRNVRRKSGPKSLCLCCFSFPDQNITPPVPVVPRWSKIYGTFRDQMCEYLPGKDKKTSNKKTRSNGPYSRVPPPPPPAPLTQPSRPLRPPPPAPAPWTSPIPFRQRSGVRKRVVPKRAVLADVRSTTNRNAGIFGCSPVPKTRTRAHSPKPPFP